METNEREDQSRDRRAKICLSALSIIQEPWTVAATGNMTLCVIDRSGNRVVKLDMLGHGTMRAGDWGERLARAYNDLALIAASPDLVRNSLDMTCSSSLSLPYPEAGLSPRPWQVLLSPKHAKVVDVTGRSLAGVSWKTSPSDVLVASFEVIARALP